MLQYASAVSIIENAAPSATLSVFGPVSVATDPFGNPADRRRRQPIALAFYYPAIDYTTSAGGVPGRLSGNAANFFGRFAPGMLASIFSFPSAPFGDTTASFGASDSTTLGDVQVSVGGTPAPLLYVSPSQINFPGSRRNAGGRLAGDPGSARLDWSGAGKLAVPDRCRIARTVHRRRQRVRPGCGAESGWVAEQWRESSEGRELS